MVIGMGIWSFSCMEAQYIAEVLKYTPAPGQFTNTLSWGSPSATTGIVGGVKGSLCLGAWGGYVVFRFAEAVENHPDNPYGVDFTIFGNPMPLWSEPGAVWVMKDENGNGLPDDSWYELAGSDYYFSTTVRNYQLSYENPGGMEAREVPWADPSGATGTLKINEAHAQPYYPLADSFPHISPEQYTLTGTLIRGAVDVDHPPVLISSRRAFGYADNQVRGQEGLLLPDNPYTSAIEHSGGDAFDLDWAVDSSGGYVDLDSIHFVKVQNALLADGKWLGELSTEVCGALDVSPDPSIKGDLNLIVIRDLPDEITSMEYPLEVHVFNRGRLEQNPDVTWTSSSEKVTVDEDHVLRASESGDVTLTASLESKPHIQTRLLARIRLETTGGPDFSLENGRSAIFPNPAREEIRLFGAGGASLSICTPDGKVMRRVADYRGEALDIHSFPPGIYLVRIKQGWTVFGLKWIKI